MPAEIRPVELQYEEYLESKNFIDNTFDKLNKLTSDLIADHKFGMFIFSFDSPYDFSKYL